MNKFLVFASTLAFAGICAVTSANAVVVSFGFSGTVSYLQNPSNALPAEITYDAPFSGIATYDTAAIVNGGDSDPHTNSGAYYFNQNGGLWLSVNIAGHRFDTTTPAPGNPYADIIIYNFADPQDVFWIDASAPTIRFDGNVPPGVYTTIGMQLSLYDYTGTALTNDALPTAPPNLAAFTNSHQIQIYAYDDSGTTFSISGDITEIGPPRPILNIQPLNNKTNRLTWPTAARGFSLLQNTNLAPGIGWQTNSTPIIDTPTEHAVTLPKTNATFFRLKFP